MKNKNKIIPIFVLFLSLLFTINFVSAITNMNPTLQSPDANEFIKGTYNINGNFANNSGVEPYANVTIARFYYRLDGTGTWTLISSVTNTSAFQIAFNLSWASTGITDYNNIQFNITLANLTDTYDSDTSNIVSVNNGVPTSTLAATSMVADTQLYALSTNTFTIAIDADSTIGLQNCTVHFGTGTTQLITASGNACSSTFTPGQFALSQGYWSYIVTANDGNGNKTNSSSRQIMVYPGSGTSGGGGGGGSGSPAETAIIQDGQPQSTPSEGEQPSKETLKQFGQKVSDVFKKMIDFFKNIFTKKS